MRRYRKIAVETRAVTTTPGYRNPNGQVVVRSSGPSRTRPGQRVYQLQCRRCGHQYGSNGIDNEKRLCPSCQGGAPGEPLRAAGPGLFDDDRFDQDGG